MQLGFVSAILPELTLREVFEFAAEVGYDSVEVMCWPKGKSTRRYAGITHIDLEKLDRSSIKEIREIIADTGVQISALGYYPNPLSNDKDEAQIARAHIKKMIRGAKVLGLDTINTFVGKDWTKSVEQNWPQFLKVWKPIIAYAEKNGIKIGIENCPMYFGVDEWPAGKNLPISPALWRAMYLDIPSKFFGLNYDPSHMIWQHMDYLTPIKEFAERIFHVHAKDVRLDQDRLDQVGTLAHPSKYHTPKIPGLGDIEWGKFLSHLTDIGFQGSVSVEVEDRSFEGSLEDRKRSLRQSYSHLRQFIS